MTPEQTAASSEGSIFSTEAMTAWPEWGYIYATGFRTGDKDVLQRLNQRLALLTPAEIAKLAATWKDKPNTNEQVIDGWAQMAAEWNRTMNSHSAIFYDTLAVESAMRIIDGLSWVLIRAEALQLPLPSLSTVKGFATGYEQVQATGASVPTDAFAGSLDDNTPSWQAALAATAAVAVCEAYTQPPALVWLSDRTPGVER